MIRNEVFSAIESVDNLGRKVISFFGPLDENVELTLKNIELAGKALDLSKISRVSTPGAGIWLNWAKGQNTGSAKIFVSKMPPNFVRVLNSIPDMIPHHWMIESFFVPYVRPLTDETENVLFIHGKHFNQKEIHLPPLTSSSIEGQKLELDVHPEKYFKFLFHRFPGIKLNQGLVSI